jgi:hypothetical protein
MEDRMTKSPKSNAEILQELRRLKKQAKEEGVFGDEVFEKGSFGLQVVNSIGIRGTSRAVSSNKDESESEEPEDFDG